MRLFIQITLCFFFVLKSYAIFGQDEIMIFNPSFEDLPQHSTPPTLWENCGSLQGSPSDIHSSVSTFFNVRKKPQDGKSFVGMVVREDWTYEAIGQKLDEPLLRNYQYQFSIYLALSEAYRSISRVSRLETEFVEPTVLRIWGGDYLGHRGQLLEASPPVKHTDWQEYTFEFEPAEDWNYFILEAYYEGDFAYNGNLLLDNCSEIYGYNNLKLSEITDFSSLTPKDLLSFVINCKEDDTNLGDTSILDVIYDSWLFQKTCKDVGMSALVTRMDTVLLENYLNIYRKMNLVKSVEIIEKTRLLSEKNTNILSEIRYLKNCNELFTESLKKEALQEKRLEYIQEKRIEIIEQLKQCVE